MPGFKTSLAFKMTVLVLGGVMLVFALIQSKSYLDLRRVIIENANRDAGHLSASLANRIEQEFRAAAKVPENLAVMIEIDSPDQDELLDLIREFVAVNQEVYGSTVAFEPFGFRPEYRAFSPYYYKSPLGIEYSQLGRADYNYFKWDWYKIPVRDRRPVWSEPYYDEGGGETLMCTYSVPFYKTQANTGPRPVRGVVTADISLTWLSDLISAVKVGPEGYAFIISQKGAIVSHPDNSQIMKTSLPELAEQSRDPTLVSLARKMMRGESGVVRLNTFFGAGPVYLAYTRIPSTGWSLAVLFSEKNLLTDLHQLNKKLLVLASVGLVMLFLVILLISRSITRPLRLMAQAAGRAAGGDLDVDLSQLIRGDEVGRLAESFDRMAKDLKQYILDLTRTTAIKERIESELNIASQIQKSMLPCIFPPFPTLEDFELFAVMEPAREVGGDFYDFFLIDDDHLALVMADVSGKGVPAALFMMISRTLIKTIANQGKPPDRVLSEVNNLLCQGNDASMFVTVFLAYYEISTGELVFANGGHNPAVIVHPDGETREFGGRLGTALGYLPDLPYRLGRDRVDRKETMVLYTDGATEAQTEAGDMFGEERFKNMLAENRDLDLKVLGKTAVSTLQEFQDWRQFDDITLLFLKRKK
ncbi:MAG: SpoIIE family protein phosphatase [Pseudomonadota bacterium]